MSQTDSSIFGSTDIADPDPRGSRLSREETLTLEEVASLALSNLNSTALAHRTTQFLLGQFGLKSCSVLMVNDDRSALLPTAFLGLARDLGPLSLTEESFAAGVFNSRRSVTIANTASEDVPQWTRAFLATLGPEPVALAIVPLLAENEAVGVFTMVWPRPREFSARDLALLETMGALIALGLRNARMHEELMLQGRMLEAHLTISPLAVIEFDGEGRITRWSEEAERIFGYQPHEVLGRTLKSLHWVYDEDVEYVRSVMRRLHNREASRVVNVNRNYRKDGTVIWCEWYSSAIYDDQGQLRSELSLVSDITARKRAEELQVAVLQIDEMLHSTFVVEELLQSALELAAAAIGSDLAAVIVPDGDRFVVAAHTGTVFDHQPESLSAEELDLHLFDRASDDALVIEDLRAFRGSSSPLASEVDLHSVIAAPLAVEGARLGYIFLGNTGSSRSYSGPEVAFVEHLGTTLALAVRNAQSFQAEHAIAQTLKEVLVDIPERLPGLEYSYATRAASPERVSGDFVDLFPVDEHTVAIVMGDVSGRGLQAAVVTALIRNTLRAFAVDGASAEAVCAKANQVVLNFTRVDCFVTVVYAVLDLTTGTLTYVSAGHPPALLDSASRSTPEELLECGPILGAAPHTDYQEQQTVLRPGERLVLYTDGFTEARGMGGDLLGSRRLAEHVVALRGTPVSQVAGELMERLTSFSGGRLRDDASVLVLEPTGRLE